MTIKERKQRVLDKIEEIKKGGTDLEKEDMRAALAALGVTDEEEGST